MSNFWYKGISSVSLVSAILAVANDHQDSSRPCVHLLSMQQRPRPQRLRIGSVAASPGKQAKLSQSSPNTNHQAVPQLTTRWIFFCGIHFFRLRMERCSGPKKPTKKRPFFFRRTLPPPGWSWPRRLTIRQWRPWEAEAGRKTQSMVKIIQFIWVFPKMVGFPPFHTPSADLF